MAARFESVSRLGEVVVVEAVAEVSCQLWVPSMGCLKSLRTHTLWILGYGGGGGGYGGGGGGSYGGGGGGGW